MIKQKPYYLYIFGIDPGIVCGFAIWDNQTKRLTTVKSCKLYELMEELVKVMPFKNTLVRIENPNTWIGFKGALRNDARLQGAGAVKQTYKHIVEMLEDYKIDFENVKLQGTLKKVNDLRFKQLTGWEGVTNEHGRDAGMMVYGF